MWNFKNWTEITKGLYRFVLATNVAYEIHILYWDLETDIMSANANLYIVGEWSDVGGKVFLNRELILEKSPLMDCIEAAIEDNNNHNNVPG